MYRRFGGLVQPENRFASIVSTRSGCKVEMHFKRHSGAFPFSFVSPSISFFPYGIMCFPLPLPLPPPPPKSSYPTLVGVIGIYNYIHLLPTRIYHYTLLVLWLKSFMVLML